MGRRIESELEGGEPHWGGRWRCSHEHVAFPVKSKVVGAGEAAVTVWTLERFDSSVFSEMSCEFIRPSKFPCASFPRAFVGFFSCGEVGERSLFFFSNSKTILTIKDSKYFWAKALDNGKGVWGRMHMYICKAQSLCCLSETVTTLLIGYELSHSVVSDSSWPHGSQATKLLCSWDSPGKNTGVGNRSLLLGIFSTWGLNSGLLHCRDSLPSEPPGKPILTGYTPI